MAKITKKGKDYFIDYIDAGGKRYIRKIGPSYEQAKYILEKKLAERVEEKYLGQARQSKPVTIAQAIPQYLTNSQAKKEPAMYRFERFRLKQIEKFLGRKYLDKITVRDVDEYIVHRLGVVSSTTVNHELTCLHALINQAVKWKMTPVNPLGKLKKLKIPPGRVRYLTLEEIGRLLKKLALHILPVVICALYTGMRKGEILALTWRDIDFRNNIIHVGKSKNHERRDIPMAPQVKEVLLAIEKKEEKIFWNIGDFKKAWWAALRRAGIKDFKFHDLRHTFASYLVINGESIVVVKELLGHKSLAMTLRYSHLAPDARKVAIQRLSQFIQIHPHSEAVPMSSERLLKVPENEPSKNGEE